MPTSKPLFGTVPSFAHAYPAVAGLQAKVRHCGEVPLNWQKDEQYSEHSIPQVIRCLNPRCQQGGYDLNPVFITLAHERTTQYRSSVYCHGHEGTAKGRKKGDPCSNIIEVKIDVEFKS